MIPDRVLDSVAEHEGFRESVYLDHLGNPTIGYGTRIEEIELDEETARAWLVRELEEKFDRLIGVIGFADLSQVRQGVILEMAYQMGVGGVLRFRRMWKAIRHTDWDAAADEMKDSRWYRDQTTARAGKLARRMRLDKWDVAP